MSSNTWRRLAQLLFVLAALSLVGVGFAWDNCGELVASLLNTDPDLTDQSALATRIRDVRTALFSVGQDIPEDPAARLELGRDACTSNFPVSESLPYLTAMVVFLLGGLMARYQSHHAPNVVIEPGRARRSGQGGFDGPAAGSGGRKPERPVASTVPIAIDVDLGVGKKLAAEDVGEEESTLMAFVMDRVRDKEEKAGAEEFVTTSIGGFFCPPGYEDKPSIYVDPTSEAARDDYQDDSPLNAPQAPFRTLEAAIKFASMRTVRDVPAMQVRVAPGVYQSSITIPDRVVVVNHRMPVEGSLSARLQWISDQELDDADRVTLLPPAGAEFAVRFGTGNGQGIFGCHLVGRENAPQAGVVGSSAHRLAIFNCVIEGFQKGGIRLDACGTEIPGNATRVMACVIEGNSAAHGAGVYAIRSVLHMTHCRVSENRAHNGGGMWVGEMKSPTVVTHSRFAYNTAQGPAPEEDLFEMALSRWGELAGSGGGICLAGGALKVTATEFVENGATLGGGGLAVLGGKALLDGADGQGIRIHRNKARAGAGILACGWPGREATLKLSDADVQNNDAGRLGGGVGLTGLSAAQLEDSKFLQNKVLDRRSLGAGVGAIHGAEVLCRDAMFRANAAEGSGGGLGGVNASIRLGEGCEVRDCTAGHSGGGIHLTTASNPMMEDLINYQGFKLPFVLALQECSILSNTSADLGGGLRAGNEERHPTFPLGIKIEATAKIRNNRTKHPNGMGDELWVVWADDVIASTQNRPGPKLLLK